MELRIHDKLEDCEELFTRLEGRDLHNWDNYDKVLMSNEKCALFFAKTGEDYWELHIAFDKEYRGKKSLQIIKSGIEWMLDNKTPRIVCGILKEKLNVRMLANNAGFKKTGTKQINNNEFELYEIRR